MTIIRFILFPLSFLYGLVTWVRNKLFDWKILPSKSYPLPIISVGNLSTGGTGKTPHIEYLIRLLGDQFKLATLSRGYKRSTHGYVKASRDTKMTDIGDEPFQLKERFPDIQVAVDEKRVRGLDNLLSGDESPDVVLLDDAFQHRYVRPGMNLLLSDYFHLYVDDFPLLTGNLREFRSGAKRADMIIVTKSPRVLSPITRRAIIEKINPSKGQDVFFSYVKHRNPQAFKGLDIPNDINIKNLNILLITGIANPYPIEIFLKERCWSLQHLAFHDHYNFSLRDMDKIILLFNNIHQKNKAIFTTEKDMMRLLQDKLFDKIKHLPLYFVPMEIEFHKEDKALFNQKIKEYVKQNSGNS